jgi:hypothetical protein
MKGGIIDAAVYLSVQDFRAIFGLLDMELKS